MRNPSFCFTRCTSLIAMFLLGLGLLSAQDYRGRIQGVVSDASQAAVTGAKVTLHNPATGVDFVRDTDQSGAYMFDKVIPGSYTVTVEMQGFNKHTQENVLLQTTGDVTVNISLSVGAVTESVNVSAAVTAVQFTTSTMSTTVAGTMLAEMPVLARNPFTLALLNPAVVNQYWDVSHRNPFYMWSSTGLDLGGGTGGKNDLLLDGVPLNISARGSYNAPMDAVQEVSVQQNAVDSEYGFSAGGIMNISMKSGTNDFHGTGYYFGRNPKLNALQDRVSNTASTVRNHIGGGTIGGPIIKNKLFFYQAFEKWKNTQPSSMTATLPTDLERQGNFSQSLTADGNLRTIYDPLTTTYDAATNTYTRQPFAGNIIPTDRIDKTGALVMSDLWSPNNPGDGTSGVNNYKKGYAWWLKYWNTSTRADWYINDQTRMYFRFSKYQTRLDNPNHGGTIAVPSDNGGIMDALNATADLLYTVSPNTTINIRYGVTYLEDDYASEWAQIGEEGYSRLWQDSSWYKDVVGAYEGIYYPRFNFNGVGSAYTGTGGWWQVHGRNHNYNINVTNIRGRHQLKFGHSLRYLYNQNATPGPGSFAFSYQETASSPLNTDAAASGDPYASLLLGAVQSGNAQIKPGYNDFNQQVSGYFQDDFRVNRRLTLNLGLRWEMETAPREQDNQFSRYIDLNNPIPELQSGVTMPSEVTNIATVAYKYNGAMLITDKSNPKLYQTPKHTFMPRIGMALKLDEKSALRIGFGRWGVPILAAAPEGWAYPIYGYSQNTALRGPQEGIPVTSLSNPFPSTNPVLLPTGNALGRYTQLGQNASWYTQDLRTPINDRFNISYQRQLPMGIVADTTFFMNRGRDTVPNSMWGGNNSNALNMVDPSLYYQHGAALDQQVDNPFYGLSYFSGGLRNEETVAISQLLRVYPQYTDLSEMFQPGFKSKYTALQFKLDKAMSHGLAFTFGYNYNRESNTYYYDDLDNYTDNKTWTDGLSPRHRVTTGGTYELPFGKGRTFLTHMHPVLEAAIGGWSTSHLMMWNAGRLLEFGGAVSTGDPTIDNPTRGQWFDTSKITPLPSYTRRSNPRYYDGLRGPGFWQLDSTLSKNFQLTERVRFELRMEMYNLPNTFMSGGVNTDPGSGLDSFGISSSQANYGREMQYTGRIHF